MSDVLVSERRNSQSAFGTTLRAITALLGGASFFILIEQGLQLGIAAPLKSIVDQYDILVQAMGELVRPLIVGLTALIKYLFIWDLHLIPSWKHVLVALGAMNAAMIRVAMQQDNRASKVVYFVGALAAMVLTLWTILKPEAEPQVTNPIIIAVSAIGVGGLLIGLGLRRLWSGRKGNEEDTKIGWIYLSTPLVVLLILLTNAGLQAVGP